MSKHNDPEYIRLARHVAKEGLNTNRRRYNFADPEYISKLSQLWSSSDDADWQIDPHSEVFGNLTGAIYGPRFVEIHILALKRQLEFIDSYQKEHGLTDTELTALINTNSADTLPFSSSVTVLFLKLLARTFEELVSKPEQATGTA